MLTERQSTAPPLSVVPEPRDRCRFGSHFDRGDVNCPAFQRAQFIAATSYGKPLGTHVACAHLLVGELSTNQFYPRCSLGSDLDKMRWIAMMGPGRLEVLRALNVEFETHYAESLRELVAAKAVGLADPPDSRAGRQALAIVVRDFLADFAAFVERHAERIAEIGVSPADLGARATRVLGEWRHSSRLDLPGLDEETILRPEVLGAPGDEDLVTAPGLMISRTSQPPAMMLIGSIDQSNLEAVEQALDDATSGGAAVTIDLAAVTFCSVAGLRMLIAAAAANNVTLHGMQPHLQRALAAAGFPVAGR